MEILKLAGLCVVCLLPVVLLRRQSPEQALLLTLAVLLAVTARSLQTAAPLLEEIRALFQRAGIEPLYVSVLLRTTAAAVVARLCAGLCKDGGSQALAFAVEAVGSIAALAIALPLLQAVVGLLMEFF